MKVNRDFLVGASLDEALERAHYRLLRMRFEPDSDRPGEYRRGSGAASVASDPSSVKAVISLSVFSEEGETRVQLKQSIDPVGRILTGADTRFWNEEMDALAREIQTGEVTPVDWSLAEYADKRDVLWPLLSVVAPLIPASFLLAYGYGAMGVLGVYGALSTMMLVMVMAMLRRGFEGTEGLSLEVAGTGGALFSGGAFELPERPTVQRWESSSYGDEKEALDDFDRRLAASLEGSLDELRSAVEAEIEEVVEVFKK